MSANDMARTQEAKVEDGRARDNQEVVNRRH